MTFRLWCAVFYVALLFGFAGIYYRLSGKHFYHANVAREPVVGEYEELISVDLEKAIIDTFESYHGNTIYWEGNWRIDAKTFHLSSLRATEKGRDVEISFKLSVRISDKSRPKRRYYVDPVVNFSALGGADIATTDSGDSSELPRNKKIRVEMPDLPDDEGLWSREQNSRFPAIFFPTKSAEPSNEKEFSADAEGGKSLPDLTMPIPRLLDTQFLNLAKGIQGDPSNLKGHFWRMFYLSAVTITTLGYGDIAPLTPRARTLILIEAVLGIIVIGLIIGGGPKKKGPCKETDRQGG
jgi:hypothetical protein